MRPITHAASFGRRAFGASLEALAIIAVVTMLALGMALATGSSPAANDVLAARGGASSPALSLSMGPAARSDGSGGSLTVDGWNFTPSAGGQQVRLWVGYPDDYCDADLSVCHGFYAFPWVEADGTFSVTYDDALWQSGEGTVSATQWNAKRGKWVRVATESYTVN